MRRGQLGLAIRELDTRLASLEGMLADAIGDAKMVQAVQERTAQLETDRQWVIAQVNTLDQAQTELQQLASKVGGWSTDIEANMAALNQRYDRLLARLEALEQLSGPGRSQQATGPAGKRGE